MVAICIIKGQRVPLIRHGRSYATLGLVGIAGFNVLFFYGMQTTSAVNAALIMALNPLMTALMAFVVGGHRPDLRQTDRVPDRSRRRRRRGAGRGRAFADRRGRRPDAGRQCVLGLLQRDGRQVAAARGRRSGQHDRA